MTVRVEPVMGSVASFDVRDGPSGSSGIDDAVAWLHEVDRRFSPYRADSEVSRIADGTLDEDAAHPDVRAILALADSVAEDAAGAFDARAWREDGRIDPSGLVKGWSVEGAAMRVSSSGASVFSISVGGDVLVRGGGTLGDRWRIGIRHPDRVDRVAKVLHVAEGAVATSAAYERGAHIRDPRSGTAPVGVRSMTVAGPSLTLADAYATAAYVLGLDGLDWVAGHDGYAALAISWDDRVRWTSGMTPWLEP